MLPLRIPHYPIYPLTPRCSTRSIHDTVTYITMASAESTDTATQTNAMS